MYEIFSRFSGIGIFFFIFLILILGFRVVPPNQANIVVRLGKPVRVRRQGWHLIIPILEGTVRQSLYDKNLAVSVDGLTLDNVKTAVGINVVYRVKQDEQSILDSKFAIDDPVRIVQATVEEQLRAKIFTFEHEEIFWKREEIGNEVREALKEKLGQYGMELDSVQVTDIALEAGVMESMNQIITQEKRKQALVREAEGRKAAQILNAEADKEVKKLIGEGMALQRQALAKGFKESVMEMKEIDATLNAKAILDFLITSSRLETLEKVGHDGNVKVIYLNENLEGKAAHMFGNSVDFPSKS
jgi:regulator of protease activity HflC (stomatin/prohibitin superfamily)